MEDKRIETISKSSKYSYSDILKVLDEPIFKAYTKLTESKLGRLLSGAEMKVILYIQNNLKMPLDIYEVLLDTSCLLYIKLDTCKKPSMYAIEALAEDWSKKKLRTQDQVAIYTKIINDIAQNFSKIKKRLYLDKRLLTEQEERYVFHWIGMGFDAETILFAADIMEENIQTVNISYLNGILNNWYAEGIPVKQSALKERLGDFSNRDPLTEEEFLLLISKRDFATVIKKGNEQNVIDFIHHSITVLDNLSEGLKCDLLKDELAIRSEKVRSFEIESASPKVAFWTGYYAGILLIFESRLNKSDKRNEFIFLNNSFDCYTENCPLRKNTTSSATRCESAHTCQKRQQSSNATSSPSVLP